MNYFKDLAPLVVDAIKTDDHKVLDAILTSVLHLTDDRCKKHVEKAIETNSYKSNSPEVEAIIIKHFPMNQEKAIAYIKSRISGLNLSRDRLDLAIEHIGDHYGLSVIQSLYAGDTEIAKKLIKAFGGRNINISESPVEKGRLVVDGAYNYSTDGFDFYDADRDQLLELVKIASDVGITRPNTKSVKGYIFDESHLEYIKPMSSSPCQSLPVIDGSKVLNPELVIAFDLERGKTRSFENIYSRIPVLMKSSELINHPSARAFLKDHRVTERVLNEDYLADKSDVKYRLVKGDASQFLKDSSKKDTDYMEVLEYAFTVFASDSIEGSTIVSRETSSDIIKDEIIIELLAPELYKTGFNDDDYILCVVDFDDIASLDLVEPDEKKLMLAEKSAYEFFCPTTISQLMYSEKEAFYGEFKQIGRKNIGIRSNNPYVNSISQYATLGDEQANIVRSFISGSDILRLCPMDRVALYAKDHLFLQKEYGITSTGTILITNDETIDTLHSGGYKFDESAKVIFDKKALSGLEPMLKILEMGKWISSSVKEPRNTSEALKSLVRKPGETEVFAYLVHQGIDKVMSEAKTDKQWEKVMELFPNEGQKIVREAPQNLKKHIISSDLCL